MNMEQAQALYRRLRERLVRLEAEPEPDLDAIDSVMAAIDETQRALKGEHGLQQGNQYAH